ncbi:hypothetical protein AB0H98_19900 [Nocardia salmonicida]|uniref:hypothetical protein n=1 Tax=Nocardia salmonicida TaxID=53431 RepID=UPI0033FC5326
MAEQEPNTRYLDDSKVFAAAEAAVAARNRDETGEIGEETPDQYASRDRAAELVDLQATS